MFKKFYVIVGVVFILLLIPGIEHVKKINYRHFISYPGEIEVNENQFKIDVLHYDLKLNLITAEKKIIGDMTITGIRKDPSLDKIYLNLFDNMKISKLLLNGKEAIYNREKKNVIIDDRDASDTFKINIQYQGTPKKAGLSGFVFGELNGNSVVYNLNEPNYACTWFPCNDIPSDKALFDMSITNDSSRISVSNGLLLNVRSHEGKRTFHWKTVYPIATYLVCVYSSEYNLVTDRYISQDGKDTMPLYYYLFKKHVDEGKKDLQDHPLYINFFAKTFGEYPFIKEKYGVAEFLWQLGAMEHQTITGIGSNFINGRQFFSDVYIHELSHHWWGDAVSPMTWNDIWLNEGFATYSEALYAESHAGSKALQSTMQSKFDEDFRGILHQPGDNLFSSTIYDKGAWVLHMLRWEVGDSAFFNILRTYYNRYKYKNASTENFRNVCEEISGKELRVFFDQWVYKGEGSIKAEYSYSAQKSEAGTKVRFNIQQIQKNYDSYTFPLEVNFLLENGQEIKKIFNIDGKNKTFEVMLNSTVKKVVPDPDKWLLAVFTEK